VVDLTHAADMARVNNPRRPIPWATLVFCASAFCFGMFVSGKMHGADYSDGVMAGRMIEQEAYAKRDAHDQWILRNNGTARLCVYADLACGYYHNPTPPHQKRP
jgi:hypothetical protein